jgi:pentapeptide MXKDX repeat protein
MNKNTGAIIGVVALVILGGIVYASMGTQTASTDMKKDVQMADEMKKDTETADEMKGDGMAVEDVKEDMKMGSYTDYSSEKIAQAGNGDVVLFFHASWCPSCRALNSGIENNLSAIPEGLTILKVNYDKETDLKKKYGVTSQHTLVQVDANGELITKWSGGQDVASIVSKLK